MYVCVCVYVRISVKKHNKQDQQNETEQMPCEPEGRWQACDSGELVKGAAVGEREWWENKHTAVRGTYQSRL